MKELNFEQMTILEGGNFAGSFCITVSLLSAGAGLYVLAGGVIATGGAAAWVWAGTVAGCAIYALAATL